VKITLPLAAGRRDSGWEAKQPFSKTYPLALFPGISATLMSVKIEGRDIAQTLTALEDTWDAFGAKLGFALRTVFASPMDSLRDEKSQSLPL